MRLHRPAALTAATLLASASTARAQQSPARAAVAHAVQAWSHVRTVRAAFEQTVSNALTGTSADARGEYQQRRPGRLAVRFADPNGDRIVADGTWLWLYLPSSNPDQVIKRPATEGGGTVDLTGAFLDDPFAKYMLTDGGVATVDGRRTRVVVLVPKSDGPKEFTKATVWIDDADGLIRQFEVIQTDGVTRRVHLTSLQINVPVDDSAFTFVVPKGAHVVAG
jgi:outer membrane lipoprotein carrier protein